MEKRRISWAVGRKWTDGNYGSYDVHHSISDYPLEGECNEKASERIYAEVVSEIINKVNKLQGKANT